MNCIYTWIILNYGVRVLYGFLELLVAEKLNDSELEDYDYLNSKIQNWYEMELINSNQLYYFNQIIYKLHSKGSSTPPLIEDYFLEMFTHYYKYKKEYGVKIF